MTVATRQDWKAETPFTIMGWDNLTAKIAQVRSQGWSDAPEELALGLNAVAAPIFDARGDCVGTIAVVGLIQTLPRKLDPMVSDAVMAAAQVVSRRLGHAPLEHLAANA
jgi:DNA-binding IclR family transcriptional regulator